MHSKKKNSKKSSSLFLLITVSLFPLIFILFSVISCASTSNTASSSSDTAQDRPQTTTGTLPTVFLNPNETYNNALYLVAVGSGDSLEQARQSALSTLLQQIEVSIDTSFETNESYQESSGSADISTQIFDSSKSSSAGTLIAVEYGESHQDNVGRLYAIAYINRQKVANIYRDRIEKNEKEIEQLLQNAATKEKLDQYAQYLKALNLSKKNQALIQQLEVISPISATTQKNSPTTINGLLRSAAQSLQFSIETNIDNDVADIDLQNKLTSAVSELLSNLQFQIVTSGETYRATASVNWSEETNDYPTIFWNINFTISEVIDADNGVTIISKNKRGRSKGINTDAARRLAINDISTVLNKTFIEYIKTTIP